MKFKKIILSGIAGGLGNILIGSIFSTITNILFKDYFKIAPRSLDLKFPFFTLIPLVWFLIGIIWSLVYSILNNGIPGKGIFKGITYGFLLWLVSSIPINILGYFNSQDVYLLANIATDLIQYPAVCLIISAVYEKSAKSKS